MELNSKFSEKVLKKSEKIKLKYRYDSSKLKGNRQFGLAKVMSPQRISQQNLYPSQALGQDAFTSLINSPR